MFWDDPSFSQSALWALGAVVMFTLLLELMPIGQVDGKNRPSFILTLIAGKDGRWSTSKASALIWTYAIAFALLTILLAAGGFEEDSLSEEYLLLLGIPASAAIAAKAITTSKVENGDVTTKTPAEPESNPISGIAQIVSGDDGRADLLDFQYFVFNIVLLAFFLTAFLREHAATLPDLPDTLLGLTGVGAAAYVGKKAAERDGDPEISVVLPASLPVGGRFTIRGKRLVSAANGPATIVQVGDRVATNPVFQQWGDMSSEIQADLPDNIQPGVHSVRVVLGDSRLSNAKDITVT